MRRSKFLAVALALTLAVSLASCTPQAVPTPEARPVTAPPSPAQGAPAPTIPTPSEWDKVVEAAKKEGKVTIYADITPLGARTSIRNLVKERYGITVEMVSGRGAELSEKISVEQRARAYNADIFDTGIPDHLVLKARGYLAEPIRVPEATNATVWKHNPNFVDPDGYIFTYYNLGTAPIANSNLVKTEEEPKSWFDLLDPKWKGKIVMDDPTTPGPGANISTMLIHYVGGVDYLRKLAEQKPKFMRDRMEEINMVIRGEYPITIGVAGHQLSPALEAGAPIKFLFLKEGTFPSAWSLSLVKNAPHPNAAKLFTNWYLSQEGQTVFSKGSKLPSFRTDVTQDYVHPQWRLLLQGKVNDYTPEVWAGRPKDMEIAAEVFGLKR